MKCMKSRNYTFLYDSNEAQTYIDHKISARSARKSIILVYQSLSLVALPRHFLFKYSKDF